jgi:hypothetical protein
MYLDSLFSCANSASLLTWGILIFLPRWRGLAQATAQTIVPLLLACAYCGLLMAWWCRSEGGFGSLAEVTALFGEKPLILAGWLHYLAFDLLVGAWIVRVAQREGVAWVWPALILTFLFGPAGYILFQAQRASLKLLQWFKAVPGESRGLLRSFKAWEPTLFIGGLGMAALFVPTLVAHLTDGRTLDGVPVWIKPLKFEASLGVFLLTLSAFYPLAGARFRMTRKGRFVVWGALIPVYLEVFYIGLQAARGEASHYNNSSTVYAALYAAMGVGAVLIVFCARFLARGILRHQRSKESTPLEPFVLSIVLGLNLSFFLGGLSGIYMGALPGHFGTAISGGDGIPGLGWSRMVGDFRVAHFLGLHALQILPAIGFLASCLLPRTSARRCILGFSVGYALWVIFTFVQAVGGRPFIEL